MKLHYKGKYDNNPDNLPHAPHKEGAVMFKEPKDMKSLAIIVNVISTVITILLMVLAMVRSFDYFVKSPISLVIGCLVFYLTLFPHELLHAICFKKDVYLYTNLSKGMLFVVGTEDMSKGRFIFMSLLPNIIFGFVPFIIGMLFPSLQVLLFLGVMAIGAGAGDYLNVFNAITQMPKGARVYMHKLNSYWYMP